MAEKNDDLKKITDLSFLKRQILPIGNETSIYLLVLCG